MSDPVELEPKENATWLPSEREWGPKFRELNDQQRAFVWAMITTGGNRAQSVALAGYSTSSESYVSRHAHRLMHNDAVLAALHEMSYKRLNGLSLIAMSAMEEILRNPHHKDRARVIEMVLSRTGFPAETHHKVEVEKRITKDELVSRALALCTRLGIEPRLLLGRLAVGPPGATLQSDFIEGSFIEVAEDL